MVKRRSSCLICDYQPVCVGGYWTFMPILCCETKNTRKSSHRRKSAR